MENVEHLAILLGVLATLLGLYKGLQGWRFARDEAIGARVRQEDSIKRVLVHLDNGGTNLVDKVDAGNRLLREHTASADVWFEENRRQHSEIHGRIDGLFELIAGRGQTEPRRAAERHSTRRATEDQEG